MPEFDIVLALFPAKENLSTLDDGWKIDQPTIDVLYLNFAPLRTR